MTFRDDLAGRLRGEVVIVGVGNPLCGDDAAGSLVARRLLGTPGLTVIDSEEVPESYLGRIIAASPDVVVLVDAVDLGAPPGALALIEKENLEAYAPATHRTPLGLVMKYLERETDARTLVIAIQPGTVGFGAPVCVEVLASVDLRASMVLEIAVAIRRPREVPA